jgi:hypothetical protein
MTYREENDQVILTLSKDDYRSLMYTLALPAGSLLGESDKPRVEQILLLANRINEGNPNYRPYQIRAAR